MLAEYQELLAALTAAGGAPDSALQQAAAELPNFKAGREGREQRIDVAWIPRGPSSGPTSLPGDASYSAGRLPCTSDLLTSTGLSLGCSPQAALERSKADVYGQLQVGSAPRQLAAIQEQRRLQRERWNREFEAVSPGRQ